MENTLDHEVFLKFVKSILNDVYDIDCIGKIDTALTDFLSNSNVRSLIVGVRGKNEMEYLNEVNDDYFGIIVVKDKTCSVLMQNEKWYFGLQIMSFGKQDRISSLHGFIQNVFTPIIHNLPNEDTKCNGIIKKMKEFDLALVQYQQNFDIPQIELFIHPVIQNAIDRFGDKIDLDAMELTQRLSDDTFLNELQAGVNGWIREIQKLTKLTNDPSLGTALQEVNFWNVLYKALMKVQFALDSAPVALTLAVLKQAKRYLATVTFAADHGLGPAIHCVQDCVTVMKDMPIDQLLAATDLDNIQKAMEGFYTQLRKVKVADQYPLPRVLKFMQAMSNAVCTQIVHVLSNEALMGIPYDAFQKIVQNCMPLFKSWDDNFETCYEFIKDLSRRRGQPIVSVDELSFEHAVLQSRLLFVQQFRMQHEKLVTVVTNTSKRSLEDIQAAYLPFLTLDILDITPLNLWPNAVRTYNACIDKVESAIIENLTNLLADTTTADEMFRVFGKFNGLFFRPRIRAAVQQFQTRLIDGVKEDVALLQTKFKAQYTMSETAKLSALRDIPPVAGAILWAKQIERKLATYMTQVETVLGAGWEQHLEAKQLKATADAFRLKLNTMPLFDRWTKHVLDTVSLPGSKCVLTIESAHIIKVVFGTQLITLFKEVRLLEQLQFRIPYKVKVLAEEGKEKYPLAVSLKASLRLFQQVNQRANSGYQTLLVEKKKAVRQCIQKCITSKSPITWDSDELEEFVPYFAHKVQALREAESHISQKYAVLSENIELLKNCEFNSKTYREIMLVLQQVIDDLKLAGFLNLAFWVNQINARISDLLAERLTTRLLSWLDNNQQYCKHQIVLRNQSIHVEPPLEHARGQIFEHLSNEIHIICKLPQLHANAFDLSTKTKNFVPEFSGVFPKVKKTVIKNIFENIELNLEQVAQFYEDWTQCQSLWDLESATLAAQLGENVVQWKQLIIEMQQERRKFDSIDQEKVFGFISVSFEHVQTHVNLRYEKWSKELLKAFESVIREAIDEFYQSISNQRHELEQCSLESNNVVLAVSLVQAAKSNLGGYEDLMHQFESSIKVLKKSRYRFSDNFPVFSNVQGEWDAFLQLVSRKTSKMEVLLPQISVKLDLQEKAVSNRATSFITEWSMYNNSSTVDSDSVSPSIAIDRLTVFEKGFSSLVAELNLLVDGKMALSFDSNASQGIIRQIEASMEELFLLKDVWHHLGVSWNTLDDMKKSLWKEVEPRKLRRTIDAEMEKLQQLPSNVRQYDAYDKIYRTFSNIKSVNKLIVALRSDSLKDRHWKKLFSCMGITCVLADFTLGDFWKSNVVSREQEVKEILSMAQGEMALEEYLRTTRDFWNTFDVELVNYQNKLMLIKGWDDMFTKIDDHLSSLASMKLSPYINAFAEECQLWENKIQKMKVVFDSWIDVQRRWVYLEGIFCKSVDIQVQLPKEHLKFQSIDSDFISTMRKVSAAPNALQIVALPNIVKTLEKMDEAMSKIQRALGDYLERQRSSFSRFCFVGDEDLLDIIGNSQEPIKVQRHLSKMFAGIVGFELSSAKDSEIVHGVYSKEGEYLKFINTVVVQKDCKINEWLTKVQQCVESSLASCLRTALEANFEYTTIDGIISNEYIQWINQFTAQVVLLSTQTKWSGMVENSISSQSSAECFRKDIAKLETVLQSLATQVLGDITIDTRKKFEQIITELVHERDVSRKLDQSNVSSLEDFTWLLYLRYYWNTSDLQIRIANAVFRYGFEYLGVSERLVQTPLTDRCYLTLSQALHLRLGGNPFGPAGTGKTETVKALGAQLGRFVLVFNCDEHFDFQAMGRIFCGLCEVGAWGCFDEFNRLEERVLSAVSQQILSIQTGLLQRNSSLQLGSRKTNLHENVGIFVTMNPGYAGRSNLPDNLKQLFRSIAMIAPDQELIAQVMLFSQGITTAEFLAKKIVLLFQLCADQLSSQSHYDFGLRALKSVLVSAGSLKRLSSDVESETELLLHSIRDTIIPKLVDQDISVFNSFVESVFPSIESSSKPNSDLRSTIIELCQADKLVAIETWTEKVMQLYQVLQLRHGVMLVGPTGSGKSSAWNILRKALEKTTSVKCQVYIIDPKAMSKELLYGVLDPVTLDWTDGVFTQILRSILNNIRNESNKDHWIVFDGDVDPVWSENLNSVLDDNKLLTLPSGERLALPATVNILMETTTLEYATMATVSRCGMVWFGNNTVSIEMMVEQNLLKLEATVGGTMMVAQLRPYCFGFEGRTSILGILFEFILAEKHIMEISIPGFLTSLFALLKNGCQYINGPNVTFPMKPDVFDVFAKNWFAYSLLWSLGASLTFNKREKLASLIQEHFSLSGNLLEHHVCTKSGEFRPRSLPQSIELASQEVSNTDIVVTTIDTLRHVSVLSAWLHAGIPFILCGPPGCGKSMTLTSTLSKVPDFILVTLNFSSSTTVEVLLKTFAQYCEYSKSGGTWTLQPFQDDKKLILFCDEINLPQADAYGTQHVITFLRQLVEQGGFWKNGLSKHEVVWVSISRIQIVGACNPPTDPGRVPLALRFLRHTPVLFVDFPTHASLIQIYGTLVHALLKITPSLQGTSQLLTNAMVEIYQQNQQKFTSDVQAHYIYSPRELSRWIRALYEGLSSLQVEPTEGELLQLVYHEGCRLFSDRLTSKLESEWCENLIAKSILHEFPKYDASLFEAPLLFTTWLSKEYAKVQLDELRKHVQARLKVFYEEELNVPLVVFDEVVDNVLHIDRVLKQPLGHLLLVGQSGVGKTVLSKFVAWMNGMSIFQIKVSRTYCMDDFTSDLRNVLKRCGCDNEKICFIFDESNVLSSAFLECMNALLASGEVPGLFEDEEYNALIHSCKESIQREGNSASLIDETNSDELYRHFTKQIQKNLHVVFTMNPSNPDFTGRTETSPALYNRCVVNWFGTWSQHALTQVAYEFTSTLDLGDNSDTVVSAIVLMHQSAIRSMDELRSRGRKYNCISPRDFIDFIKHLQKTFVSKREKIEQRKLHVRIGLEKLLETEQQVAELQGCLAIKKKTLGEKDAEANIKLQQMVQDQKEAERKKHDAEELAKDIAIQEETIATRKAIAEKDLEKAEPALIDAKKSVKSIKKSQLDELRALARPPAAVQFTIEAVAFLLGETSLDWADLRKFIRKDDFINLVVNFNSEKMTPKARADVSSKYLSKNDMDYEKVQRASKACGPLYKWITSQIEYSTILHNVEPLRKEVAKLEVVSEELRTKYNELQQVSLTLEASIAKYKNEYAGLIQEAQTIKVEMEKVRAKVDRSTALIRNLANERSRWEQSNTEFTTQMTTVVGDSMLSAAFLTYSGFLDFRQRHSLLQDWKDVLSNMEIAFNSEYSVLEYLSDPSERLSWHLHELPVDDLCIENGIILSKFNRFPLVIDPSNQAQSFLLRQYPNVQTTSFLDDAFMKVLASAIRFGTPLLVQDVEAIDPILNPILNREIYHTGGRVLIQLGGEEIDYSPEFKLFLLTRNPSCRFSPDVCSRVTFVNFTMTASSLERQAMTRILASEKPTVDAKKTELIVQRQEYTAKLLVLEESLLNEIRSVEGNILDDDSVIKVLENLKNEAAEVQNQVIQSNEIMDEINTAIGEYDTLAKIVSKIYFLLEDFGRYCVLYQFSLHSYFLLLAKALSTHSNNANRISFLQYTFYEEVIRVTAQSLRHDDRFVFALRVFQIHQDTVEFCKWFPTESEWSWILHPFEESTNTSDSSIHKFSVELPMLDTRQCNAIFALFATPDFAGCFEKFMANTEAWKVVINSKQCVSLPNGWDSPEMPTVRKAFRDLLIVSILRPDWVLTFGEAFLKSAFSQIRNSLNNESSPSITWSTEIQLEYIVEHQSSSDTPLLLCSSLGYDPSGQVDDLAKQSNLCLKSIAMGSSEGYELAEKAILSAMKKGNWVLLGNIHLCPKWLFTLEKQLHTLQHNRHSSFRLFFTANIAVEVLPENLVRMSHLLIFEQPVGFKASLSRSVGIISGSRIDKKPIERNRLYFLLIWFRAIVQERLRYTPIGWTKKYEFSVADASCGLQIIDNWVNCEMEHIAPADIPWKAIKTLLVESIYGGKIDNEFDKIIIQSLADQLFSHKSFDLDFPLVQRWCSKSNALKILVQNPNCRTLPEFVTWIENLASTNTPEWLGLPESADAMLLQERGMMTLRNFRAMQDLVSVALENTAADASNFLKQTQKKVQNWILMLPKINQSATIGNMNNPIRRFVVREFSIGSTLYGTVIQRLQEVLDVCNGLEKPHQNRRLLIEHITADTIPSAWKSAFNSVGALGLSSWVIDFAKRLEQVITLESLQLPELMTYQIWLGGLFNPEGYIAAHRQAYASQQHCSVESLRLVLHGEKQSCLDVANVSLQGASWSPNGGLELSDTMHCSIELAHLRWSKIENIHSMLRFPVYRDHERKEVLFDLLVANESKIPPFIWHQRGVAFVLWQKI